MVLNLLNEVEKSDIILVGVNRTNASQPQFTSQTKAKLLISHGK